ncbi:MAG: peptidoglycan DD-metalloendopeptidase family protein [Anaerolineae bacterium]|nr:peptidoglycan DD-metalloendopeptidase family protein [Anaerolineae bacterium]
MKRWLSLSLNLLLVFHLAGGPHAAIQPPQPTPAPQAGEGEGAGRVGDELSPAQEQALWEDIQRNLTALRNAGNMVTPNASQPVPYAFPLKMAPGLPDAAGFRVSAFVDHNPAGGQVLDYTGGARSYDGHRGTDYALTPFSWNKLDAGDVQVVAAAAGTIVSSANVDPSDRNCGSGSSDPWNYVALVHADGRMTIYGHLRYNSLTSKGVGQAVAQGEVLGTVGSSGNSSGPHLHFEVRTGSFSSTEWIDPYSGPNSQPESLWISQRPYYDSAINKLSTHSAPPSTPNACQPSISNLQDTFTTPARVYFYAFYRDYQSALPTQLKLVRPNGSVYQSWSHAPGGNSFYSSWNQGWVVDLPSGEATGAWRFEANYNGQLTETFFNVNDAPAIHVTSPNGAENWDRRTAQPVTWTDNIGGAVNISIYLNGAYAAAIAYNTPSDGEYLWVMDAGQALASGYTIRVTSAINPAVVDQSDAAFSIVEGIIARDDAAMTAVNAPVTIPVLGNDQGAGSAPLTITAVEAPGHGVAVVDGQNIVYTPAADYLGSDSFTYTVESGLDSATATVSVMVVAEVHTLFLPALRR